MEIAKFVSELTFKDLPSKAIERTKELFLDYIGVTIGGSTSPEARIVHSVLEKLGGTKESTVIGFDYMTSCQNAAFANGIIAHSLEYEDTHFKSIVHVSPPVISAALSMAEREKARGESLITSIVAGYEVAARVGMSVAPNHFYEGFHPTGTCGAFGAAASAGVILGLDEESMTSALGLAGTQAAGLNLLESMGKRLNAGRAAENGVIAALLAKEGFTGHPRVIESKWGFGDSMSSKFDPEAITRNLGKSYEILDVSIKTYPCCRGIHSVLDALFEIIGKHNITSEEIDRINVRLSSKEYVIRGVYEPKDTTEALLSFPYIVAIAAMDRTVGLEQITKEKFTDPRVLNLAKRIKIIKDQKLDKLEKARYPTVVEVYTKSGNRYMSKVEIARGEPENWVDAAFLINKFKKLALMVLDEERINKILTEIKNLESIKDVSEFTKLLNKRSY